MKQYVADAFTEKVFGGNPAAVCVIDEWLSDELMLKIAVENNLSETAFIVPKGEKYQLRWFTPGGEVDLCGHATLASAFVMMTQVCPGMEKIVFESREHGDLVVTREGDIFAMDFPVYELKEVPVTQAMADATGVMPIRAYLGRDLLCEYESEDFVRNMSPDQDKLLQLDGLLLHATAKGKEYDCVSRSFAPKLNIPEDPVCGSGHCHIVPFWAKELGKSEITAYQASKRGGTLYCTVNGEKVILRGKAALYSVAEIFVD